ncbi:MAG: hypothetical protein GC151_15580 [Betaproteobacteria bacterium]|nr:hypothetical protein [Betaproteobacteria bacterium]
MPFPFYQKLSAARRRTYDRSDTITALAIPGEPDFSDMVQAVHAGLREERPRDVQRACQRLVDTLADAFAVPPLRVIVRSVRPNGEWGELHGLYVPGEHDAVGRVELWMRTARQRRVVAARTFLRTLLHEFCHHLDYELFRLSETFHTEGFYRRESHLLDQVAGPSARATTGATTTGTRGATAQSSS